MTVRTSPCDWPVSYAECNTCEPLQSLAPSGVAMYEQMAVDYLWNWTGRALGICEVSLRPCRQRCDQFDSTYFGRSGFPNGWRSTYTPALIRGQWYNIGCGTCGDNCGCGLTPSLTLPGPVDSIEEILIDGQVLDPSSYEVQNGSLLIRTDDGRWPTCQNLSLPSTEPGTWEITYIYGIRVPIGGQIAAGVLACELAKAACGDEDCGLPQRVQSITRQGVTVAILDAFDDIDKGHTGIWIIDSWLASMTKTPQTGRVYSPEYPNGYSTGRRRTWP